MTASTVPAYCASLAVLMSDGKTFSAPFVTINGNRSEASISAPESSVPTPATLPLFATGLGMMGWFAWRRKRQHHQRYLSTYWA
jgi:hypothetical protein